MESRSFKKTAGAIFAALLAALLALTILVSCAEKEDGKTEDSAPAADNTETAESETESDDGAELLKDNLPETDMEGYVFRILMQDDMRQFLYSKETDGNVVNDAVYKANLNVKERFNIDIQPVTLSNHSDSAKISTLMLAGDDVFDIAQLHDCTAGSLTVRGYFKNIYDIDHLDFEKPWWPKFTVESLTLSGKMYLISNYMSYRGINETRVMWVSNTLVDKYGLESPYDLVRNGAWTIDKANEMTSSVYSDLNGNGKVDTDDEFGYMQTGTMYCWLECFGIELFAKNDTGDGLVYNNDSSALYTLVEKMRAWVKSGSQGVYFAPESAMSYSVGGLAADRVLLTYQSFKNQLNGLTDSDADYGILPMPKLDENQTEYYAACTDLPVVVPVNGKLDNDRLGIIIEAMSAEGYKNILPAYYDIALKYRYSKNQDSSEMLDIIFKNRVMSFTYIYYDYGGTAQLGALPTAIGTGNLASYLASLQKLSEKYMQRIVNFYNTGNING